MTGGVCHVVWCSFFWLRNAEVGLVCDAFLQYVELYCMGSSLNRMLLDLLRIPAQWKLRWKALTEQGCWCLYQVNRVALLKTDVGLEEADFELPLLDNGAKIAKK